MDLIASFSAARVLILSGLVLVASTGRATQIVGCGTNETAPGRYLVRARLSETLSSASVKTSASTLLSQVIARDPSALIHKDAPFSSPSRDLAAESLNPSILLASAFTADEIDALKADGNVLSIENDCLVKTDALEETAPNDPLPTGASWPRQSLNLEKAWAVTTDTAGVIVGISDTGVDLSHPDLKANLWTNRAELNGLSGFDDDGNGCIDDIHGCDLADDDGDPSPGTSTELDHGTHVAGIIGAVGNNAIGLAGVAWKTTLLASKGFSNSDGSALSSDLLRSVYYAVNSGARVVNCSWGIGRAPTQTEIDAFRFALTRGTLPVVAAGNSSVDAATTSPAAIPGVLTVGSINSHDIVSGFSNFGAAVAVYAPGGDALSAGGSSDEFIYSTLPTAHGSYGNMRGTSMAAPFVTGIAALIFGRYPGLTPADVKSAIVMSARTVSSRLPNGALASIRIPDAEAALTFAATLIPHTSDLPATEPSKPTVDAPALPAQTKASAGGCALSSDHFSSNADRGDSAWLLLIVALPAFVSTLLRRRKKT